MNTQVNKVNEDDVNAVYNTGILSTKMNSFAHFIAEIWCRLVTQYNYSFLHLKMQTRVYQLFFSTKTKLRICQKTERFD